MAESNHRKIIAKAKALGASHAGITSFKDLMQSPVYRMLEKFGIPEDDVGSIHEATEGPKIELPRNAKSVLVIAVSHPRKKPELDWWDGVTGTPGNRTLIRINGSLAAWIESTLEIKTHKIPYYIVNGGIYLKDAAVLAGLGCIGKHNLLITPELGPHVRLRAMLLEKELPPTGPIAFDPCKTCKGYCRNACPEKAFVEVTHTVENIGMEALPGRDGAFSRPKCNTRMDKNISDSGIDLHQKAAFPKDAEGSSPSQKAIKYCRRCELACPVGVSQKR